MNIDPWFLAAWFLLGLICLTTGLMLTRREQEAAAVEIIICSRCDKQVEHFIEVEYSGGAIVMICAQCAYDGGFVGSDGDRSYPIKPPGVARIR